LENENDRYFVTKEYRRPDAEPFLQVLAAIVFLFEERQPPAGGRSLEFQHVLGYCYCRSVCG
jgi:hypothetical protein